MIAINLSAGVRPLSTFPAAADSQPVRPIDERSVEAIHRCLP
jgi:hypothetical protein